MPLSFEVAAASGTFDIPELDITLTTTLTDLLNGSDPVLLTEVLESRTLLEGIESGAVVTGNTDGVAVSSLGLDGSTSDVSSVNGQSGVVLLDASDILLPAGYSASAGVVAASDPTADAIAKLDARDQYYKPEYFTGPSSSNPSTNNTTTFEDAISGNTSALVAGDYELTVSYSWNYDSTTSDFISELLWDGASIVADSGFLHQQEPQDSGGGASPAGSGTNQRYAFQHMFYLPGVSAGSKPVLLRFRSSSNGVEATMWDALIKVQRVD